MIPNLKILKKHPKPVRPKQHDWKVVAQSLEIDSAAEVDGRGNACSLYNAIKRLGFDGLMQKSEGLDQWTVWKVRGKKR